MADLHPLQLLDLAQRLPLPQLRQEDFPLRRRTPRHGSYYPVERNRNGEWRDLHLLQEFYFRTRGGDRWSLNAWYLDSKRGLPATTVSYRDDDRIVNEGRERTLRSVAGWERTRTAGRLAAKAGYIYSRTAYDFRNDRGDGTTADMMHVRNRVHTLFADLAGEYRPGERWYFTAAATPTSTSCAASTTAWYRWATPPP